VVTGVSGTQQSYVSPDCSFSPPLPTCVAAAWVEYTAGIAPPDTWTSFGGTCRLRVDDGPSTIYDQPVACAAGSVPIGVGTGGTWYITVQICSATVCATSEAYPVATQPVQTWP
jgi:hypothetical protein